MVQRAISMARKDYNLCVKIEDGKERVVVNIVVVFEACAVESICKELALLVLSIRFITCQDPLLRRHWGLVTVTSAVSFPYSPSISSLISTLSTLGFGVCPRRKRVVR